MLHGGGVVCHGAITSACACAAKMHLYINVTLLLLIQLYGEVVTMDKVSE